VFTGSGVVDHGELGGLADDDHTQYVLLAGRATGQTIIGGTASGDDLTLASTSHATKGDIILDGPAIASSIRPSTDSATAIEIQNAAGTEILTIDSAATGGRIGIGQKNISPTFPNALLHLESAQNQQILLIEAETNVGNNALQFNQSGTGRAAYFWRDAASPVRAVVEILEVNTGSNQRTLSIYNVGTGLSFAVDAGGGAITCIDASANIGVNTSSPTISDGVGIDVNGKIMRLRTSKTPASAAATGNVGEICWDSGAIYVCVAANTWKKVAIATW
jgi:hypothetical protein